MEDITHIGRVSTATPPVGDFNVTKINKDSARLNGQNYDIVLSWTPPAGGADRYEIEWFSSDGVLLNPDNKTATANSIALTIPKKSEYSLKIISHRGPVASYIIIEDIVKLEET